MSVTIWNIFVSYSYIRITFCWTT